ncbi:hypothetical protein [Roseomonas sp. KE0001]|uniref:hypothetical protein n=1 Tax=Roseomonas sp. KE0001 TaxID=2479201 RepID=UPI0018DF6936|nr:hypothetical protein [Roseomonas sp. KE0001]MBI0432811.1 hypothetical protein [Roseomonas sp. KE0001]
MFRVTRMNVYTAPQMGADHAVIATMGIDYGAIRLTHAALVVTRNGEPRVYIPNYGRNRIVLVDREAREALLQSALAAYRALAGTGLAELPFAKASSKQEASECRPSVT